MATTIRQTPLTCSGHTRPVVQLCFSDVTENGYYLISACKASYPSDIWCGLTLGIAFTDGKPMLRQGETGDWIGTFEGHKGAVWGVSLNREATRAATGAADYTAKASLFLLFLLSQGIMHKEGDLPILFSFFQLWDAVSGEELQTFTHKHIVKSVDFSKDGCKLLTGSNEKIIKIFDLTKIDAEPAELSGHDDSIRQALFLPDQRMVISAGDDCTVRLWDLSSGREVRQLEFPNPPSSMEVSQDGQILTLTYGNHAAFWDLTKFEKVREIRIPTRVHSASLHPARTVFVCGGEDFKMYKYNFSDGSEVESFKGHFGPIHCVRFSPDGELYASGSEDGTLRLWQTTVGKTYGLWKCVDGITNDVNSKTDSVAG
ncbi:unnamed protein product [Darwinula stevensoni]|uniref:Serine-threonine kinase receptor-associated protein n=1 Tax=Darwinula stevensoni TaxID=69355 RepID=A0A7R8WZD6_9CRUS|nr:unnamed protein product [Darwinula stevensoni]CAG0880441.1 unnamed protein product [Darwinula stevensoni]